MKRTKKNVTSENVEKPTLIQLDEKQLECVGGANRESPVTCCADCQVNV